MNKKVVASKKKIKKPIDKRRCLNQASSKQIPYTKNRANIGFSKNIPITFANPQIIVHYSRLHGRAVIDSM